MESVRLNEVWEFYKICKIVDGVLQSPILYSIDTNKNYRTWQVMVGLIKLSNSEVRKPVIEDYINHAQPLPEGYIGGYWTVTGVEKTGSSKVTAITRVEEGAGRGSAKLTPLTQAIHQARGMFNDEEKSGRRRSKEELTTESRLTIAKLKDLPGRGSTGWRVKPMALHKFEDHKHKLIYPVYALRKADGGNMTVVFDRSLPTIVVPTLEGKKVRVRADAYTRGLESAPSQYHVVFQMFQFATRKEFLGYYWVGESYRWGDALEKASGKLRRIYDTDLGDPNDFYIFDCFNISQPDLSFEARLSVIQSLRLEVETARKDAADAGLPDPAPSIKFVDAIKVYNEEELMKLYKSWLKEGWEGAVVHQRDSLYTFGLNGERRSSNSLKLKPRPDEEYPLVGFTHGEGEFEKQVKWICAENEVGCAARIGSVIPIPERETFNVGLNMPRAYCEAALKFLQSNPSYFKSKLYGAMVTVSYHTKSKDKKLPVQGRFVKFFDAGIARQFEIDIGYQE